MKKVLTLALVMRNDELLLGMKKRGFGEGRWNGFGGKVEEGETVEAAARREVEEEVGISVTAMEEVGVLDFSFAENDKELEVHVFIVTDFVGLPRETEEMRPAWFEFANVPYEMMWPDDVYWLPLLLEGKTFRGTFHFDRPSDGTYTSVILKKELSVLS